MNGEGEYVVETVGHDGHVETHGTFSLRDVAIGRAEAEVREYALAAEVRADLAAGRFDGRLAGSGPDREGSR